MPRKEKYLFAFLLPAAAVAILPTTCVFRAYRSDEPRRGIVPPRNVEGNDPGNEGHQVSAKEEGGAVHPQLQLGVSGLGRGRGARGGGILRRGKESPRDDVQRWVRLVEALARAPATSVYSVEVEDHRAEEDGGKTEKTSEEITLRVGGRGHLRRSRGAHPKRSERAQMLRAIPVLVLMGS